MPTQLDHDPARRGRSRTALMWNVIRPTGTEQLLRPARLDKIKNLRVEVKIGAVENSKVINWDGGTTQQRSTVYEPRCRARLLRQLR